MKKFSRILTALLSSLLFLTLLAGCTAPDPDDKTTSEETPAFDGVILTQESKIFISSEADDTLTAAAKLAVETIRKTSGLLLGGTTVATEASDLCLAVGTPAGGRPYEVTLSEGDIRVTAVDSATLYFALEDILSTWLTSDFGLSVAGQLTLPAARVGELMADTTRLDNSIKVLSQNMRYADDPNRNTVQLRSQRFMKLLKEYDPDLFGAQEYTKSWNVWLQKHTKKAGGTGTLDGYGTVGCSRDGRETEGGEFNPVFYRLDRFELLDSDTFWLSETPDVVSKVETSSLNRICTWVRLKDKKTGETLVFANTHLDHTNDEARRDQAVLLIKYLSEIAGDDPLYLTGDFNCTIDSTPYATIVGTLTDSHKSAWEDRSAVKNTYHDYTEEGYSEIDFVFYNGQATPISYEIISKGYDGFVSDHYGVITEFVPD